VALLAKISLQNISFALLQRATRGYLARVSRQTAAGTGALQRLFTKTLLSTHLIFQFYGKSI